MTSKQIKKFHRFLKEQGLYATYEKYSRNKYYKSGYYWYLTDGMLDNKLFFKKVNKYNVFLGVLVWANTKVPSDVWRCADMKWHDIMNEKIRP